MIRTFARRHSLFRWVLFCWLVLLWTTSSAAQAPRASESARVELYAANCSARPYDGTRLVELLRVELSALGVELTLGSAQPAPQATSSTPLALVSVTPETCSENAQELKLEIIDAASAKRLERTLLIADVAPVARTRVIAIAISELLQASWTELELTGSAPPVVALPAKARAYLQRRLRAEPQPTASHINAEDVRRFARTDGTQSRTSSWTIDAAGVARSFPGSATGLIGGEFSVLYRISAPLTLSFGGDFGVGATNLPFPSAGPGIANVDADAQTGFVGAALKSPGSLSLEIGPRFYAGRARLKSHSGVGSAGFLSMVTLSALLRAQVSQHVTAFAGVDVGHTLTGVFMTDFSDEPSAVGIIGVASAARVGVGLHVFD